MNSRLRRLLPKDAPLMLEWMHDEEVICNLQAEKFRTMTLIDCQRFINACSDDTCNLHMAIVDDDTYMGTVSLKCIDMKKKEAEFAIAMRRSAMGTGMAKIGMQEILRMGFEKIGLKKIYWDVRITNARAIRFYEKSGYKRWENVPEAVAARYNLISSDELIWFCIENVKE